MRQFSWNIFWYGDDYDDVLRSLLRVSLRIYMRRALYSTSSCQIHELITLCIELTIYSKYFIEQNMMWIHRRLTNFTDSALSSIFPRKFQMNVIDANISEIPNLRAELDFSVSHHLPPSIHIWCDYYYRKWFSLFELTDALNVGT